MQYASAVLFAKDMAKLAAFYRDVLGVGYVYSDAYHIVMRCGTFALDIHQVPAQHAQGMQIDVPPQRRELAAVKLCFPVDSIARARETAAKHGGQVDAGPPTWVVEQQKYCDGHDPEGNVFQLKEDD